MTALTWDRIEDRQFQTGVERGVLHLASEADKAWDTCHFLVGAPAIAWNGLVSVADSPSRESKVYYQDGIKVLERLLAPAYAGKIQAFTYPDVLDVLMGNRELTPGVHLHEQDQSQLFHLAYRTRLGSALEGVDHGYKLHLVYNLLLNPSDTTFETISEQVSPNIFEWAVSATPMRSYTFGSTDPPIVFNHISLDSRTTDPTLLAQIETDLYGSESTEPKMPNPFVLLSSF